VKDVACVLLAAGMSERMGNAKLLMRVGARTVFEIALANHMDSSVSSICAVVAGWIAGFKDIVTRYSGGSVEFIEMEHPCPMSASLKAGWSHLQTRLSPDAVMISLADKPLVSARTIDKLIAAYGRSDMPICVPAYRGRWGHPVIISSGLHSEIMDLDGDQGARQVLRRHRDEVEEVVVGTDEVLVDVDRVEDLDTLRSRLEKDE
jgi:molybdenum cofactor cytidylyltransferase